MVGCIFIYIIYTFGGTKDNLIRMVNLTFDPFGTPYISAFFIGMILAEKIQDSTLEKLIKPGNKFQDQRNPPHKNQMVAPLHLHAGIVFMICFCLLGIYYIFPSKPLRNVPKDYHHSGK